MVVRVTPVILCGGRGSRLWPFSAFNKPKPFVSLPGMSHSLLQETVLMLSKAGFHEPILIVQQDFATLVAEQLEQIKCPIGKVIIEPFQNGTATAATLAALIMANDTVDDELLLIMPIDHYFAQIELLFQRIDEIIAVIQDEIIVFGIKPTKIDTNYGYMVLASNISREGLYKVDSFFEKPDADSIKILLEHDCCYWNSGIFLSKRSVFLNQVSMFAPELYQQSKLSVQQSIEVDKKVFLLPFILESHLSIDKAIIEKSDQIFAAVLDVKWGDMGNLYSAWEYAMKDENGNVSGANDLLMDTSNSYVFSDKKPITVLGLSDVFVVNNDNAILVASKNSIGNVSAVYNHHLTQKQCSGYTTTPWGCASFYEQSANFAVKKLRIDPLQSTSLQFHKYRSEYIIVCEGVASVIRDDEQYILKKGEGMAISACSVHRIKNDDISQQLVLIEVQMGEKVEESDVIRIQDDYGRFV